MLSEAEFQQVQNGQPTGNKLTPAYHSRCICTTGAGLAAYTHDDVLYEAYFMAYLVLNTINTAVRCR